MSRNYSFALSPFFIAEKAMNLNERMRRTKKGNMIMKSEAKKTKRKCLPLSTSTHVNPGKVIPKSYRSNACVQIRFMI